MRHKTTMKYNKLTEPVGKDKDKKGGNHCASKEKRIFEQNSLKNIMTMGERETFTKSFHVI